MLVVPVGIEGGAILENAVSEMDEFAHDGANNDHGGFTLVLETLDELNNERIVTHGGECGQIERATHGSFAHFAHPGFLVNGTARLIVSRVNAGIGGGGMGIGIVR